ncbi:isoprenylcysteine carboxylmethyltransferase family protein [Antarcticibacterium arcticum]|uniref:Isoprenylcysteine carboxylmethyltransferase family protein n=1 Tax=Antarcticibacterium arcticum TaxID=2585771 RepID=A0A5B8YHQ6_9FLAO|nr:methyltransferase [Antarcticibacterium arcticum]QED37364.1 isoprenylcysteine carboxylmethyltransferase family protein [Antarcticibacterium arcticum]
MKGTAYLVQSALVSLWWLGLVISKDFYQAFQFPGISGVAFNSFFAPDLFVITFLSIIRAYKPSRDLELIILGGFAYGSLYCVNASLFTSGGYLPTIIMLLGLFYNLFLVYQSNLFRESKSGNVWSNGFQTVIQILSIWSITLILFPWIIIDSFEIQMPSSQLIKVIAYVIIILSSLFGLSSAYFLVLYGNGTPLPAYQTNKLVVRGPYKYVRNPMAIAGIGQGLAISIYFSSIHLLIYTILGGLLWHIVVRPIEEKNMFKRFGKDYQLYRDNVKLWLPKIR